MQYLPLFLLFAAALIAGYFYLQRAKRRDAGKVATDDVQTTETGPTDRPQ
jgi:hypothetical protein